MVGEKRVDHAQVPGAYEKPASLFQATRWLGQTNFGATRKLVLYLLGEADFVMRRIATFPRPDFAATQLLVFVCCGNIKRSTFADAVAASLGGRPASIGLSTKTGAPAFVMAVQAAARIGRSLDEHRATNYPDYVHAPGDLMLAMEVLHARNLVRRGIASTSIALLGHWARPHRVDIHDAHTLSEPYFRSCFALTQLAIVNLVGNLRRHHSPCVTR